MAAAVPDILAKIVRHKRATLVRTPMERAELERRAADRPPSRDFRAALLSHPPAIISEIKKASPSKGVFTQSFYPVELAKTYASGGAAALSVLTDEEFFGGSWQDFDAARAAVSVPVLRKDFTIDAFHVIEAAAHAADAILLIAAILSTDQMRLFREFAAEHGMASLVEVHNQEELAKALDSGAEIVGVNNRNLHTFDVTLDTSLRLVEKMPASVLKVAESGIHSSSDVLRLRAAGFNAFLVGEHLMKSADPGGGAEGTKVVMVKVCGITRREDAQVAVDAGASAIGFVFHRASPRYIQPERAAKIGAGLMVLKVGIFVDLLPQEVTDIMHKAQLDIAQIYGGQTPQGARAWRAVRMPLSPDHAAIEYMDCEAVLMDGPANGISFDWNSAVGKNAVTTKLIVAGGLDASNVAEAIRIANPWGVDASSKLETSPGIKNHEKVKAFVAAALAEFNATSKEPAC